MIVVIDVALECKFEKSHVLEFSEMKELGLEHGEEALDGRVVETVALSGHVLGDAVFAQLRRERSELVFSALGRMEYWPSIAVESHDGLVQYLADEWIPRLV